MVRLSVKLFNCTPAQLPGGLREQLCGWLNSTPACAEGFIRPGCLQLTCQARARLRRAAPLAHMTAPWRLRRAQPAAKLPRRRSRTPVPLHPWDQSWA